MYLPIHIPKMYKILLKNAIVTSLPLTEGTPFLSIMSPSPVQKNKVNKLQKCAN